MSTDAFKDIEKLESDLWAVSNTPRVNSKLTSSDYFMPLPLLLPSPLLQRNFSATEPLN